MNSKKYKWLLIDLDDTILDYKKSELTALEKTFTKVFGAFNEEMHQQYDIVNKKGWKLFQNSAVTIEEVKHNRFEKMLELYSSLNAISPDELNEEYIGHLSKQTYMLDGAGDFLGFLSSNGFKPSIITNGIKNNQLSRIKLSGIGEYFEEIIISEDAGLAKPHKQFFDYAKEKIGFENDRTLVIGDNLESDIKGGNDYGLDTCWFNYFDDINESNIVPVYETGSFTELVQLLSNNS